MNKTGFKATVIVCGAILAILGAALTFMLCNIVPTAWMERVEINGRVIPVTGAELRSRHPGMERRRGRRRAGHEGRHEI